MNFKYLIIALTITYSTLMAQEHSESFLVDIFDTHMKVVTPSKHHKEISVTVVNNTLSDIKGKIFNKTQNISKYIAVDASEQTSVLFNLQKNDQLFFIPFAPAFHEAELIVGKRAYEIPPQR